MQFLLALNFSLKKKARWTSFAELERNTHKILIPSRALYPWKYFLFCFKQFHLLQLWRTEIHTWMKSEYVLNTRQFFSIDAHTENPLLRLCFAFRMQISWNLVFLQLLWLYLFWFSCALAVPQSIHLSVALRFSTKASSLLHHINSEESHRFQFNWHHSVSKLLLCKLKISASSLQSDGSRCCFKLSKTNGFLVLSCPSYCLSWHLTYC